MVREALHFFLLFYGILPKGGGGGLGRSKSFESLFFGPEAIKSKQMSMCQKAKNNEKNFFKFVVKEFWGKKVTQKSGHFGKIP